MKRVKKRAFTLIELLVVIAIIAILAAILFPVFAQAKLAAKNTVTLSGTKQLGLAAVMYTNDYDDTVVLQQSFNTGAGYQQGVSETFSDPTWHACGELLYPYVKNQDLMFDPLQTSQSQTELSYWKAVAPQMTQLQYDMLFTTLQINKDGYASIQNDDPWPGQAYDTIRSYTGIQYVSQRIAFAESVVDTPQEANYIDNYWFAPYNHSFSFDFEGVDTVCPSFSWADAHGTGSGREGDGSNPLTSVYATGMYLTSKMHLNQVMCAYADGHAKAVPTTALISNSDVSQGNPENPGGWNNCQAEHFAQYGYWQKYPQYFGNQPVVTPTGRDAYIIEAIGKYWDPSY